MPWFSANVLEEGLVHSLVSWDLEMAGHCSKVTFRHWLLLHKELFLLCSGKKLVMERSPGPGPLALPQHLPVSEDHSM